MTTDLKMEILCNMENIRDILQDMGYILIDSGSHYRSKPLYRDSGSSNVLSIEKSTGRWYDFKERIGGSFDELVRKTLNLPSIDDTKKWLSGKINSEATIEKDDSPLIKEPATYPAEYLTRLYPIYDYWEKRGVSSETLIHFKSGLAMTGKMANRYVFPIFNSKSEILGFAGRDILNHNDSMRPKWKLIGKKSNWCYPLFFNKNHIINSKEIIIVESIGDMLSLWEAGIKNCAVSFGLDLPNSLIKFLLKVDVHNINISLNNDINNNEAGNKAAHQMKSKLLNYFDSNQVSINLPDKKDFGEMTKEEILEWKNKKTK